MVADDGDEGRGSFLKCRSCCWTLCPAHAHTADWWRLVQPMQGHRLMSWSLTETLDKNGDDLFEILQYGVNSSMDLNILDRILTRTEELVATIHAKMDEVKVEENVEPPAKCRRMRSRAFDID